MLSKLMTDVFVTVGVFKNSIDGCILMSYNYDGGLIPLSSLDVLLIIRKCMYHAVKIFHLPTP